MDIALHDGTRLKAVFAFHGHSASITGVGDATQIPSGPSATLDGRVGGFLGKGIIGGALPFDSNAPDHLWHAAQVDSQHPLAVPMPALNCRLRAEPSEGDYAAAVAKALRIMDAEKDRPDGLAKIVLARTLAVIADRPIPPAALLSRLAQDPAVTAFQVPLPDGRQLIGATPELLLEKAGKRISSHPLAGSARRQASHDADAAIARALSQSDKDQREHAIVVEYILDTLAPYCSSLHRAKTDLTSTRTMWHLGTRIEGELRDATIPSVVLAARLHPTPAICGLPRNRAAALIHELEPVPRDFYAGAVGWCDATGDGCWYVAIRCAEIRGTEARLFAGAGIVPGSDPMAEAAETGAKFGALLAALGLPADAAIPI